MAGLAHEAIRETARDAVSGGARGFARGRIDRQTGMGAAGAVAGGWGSGCWRKASPWAFAEEMERNENGADTKKARAGLGLWPDLTALA